MCGGCDVSDGIGGTEAIFEAIVDPSVILNTLLGDDFWLMVMRSEAEMGFVLLSVQLVPRYIPCAIE
jgi:hypothetical protein